VRPQNASGRHLHAQLATVERLDLQHRARERVDERHARRRLEVVAVALEARVRPLLQHDDHVAGLHAGRLVGLATKRQLLTCLHARCDVDVDKRLGVGDLLALARAAHVASHHAHAATVTVVALTSHALHKAWSDALRRHDDTVAATRRARRRLLAALRAVAAARRAHSLPHHSQLHLSTFVQIFEIYR
jgi:hypothetical protein